MNATFAADASGRVLDRLATWRISYEPRSPDERLIAAAVLCADGDETRLAECLDLAEEDWRDLLVAGGLAGQDWPDILDRRLGLPSKRA